MTEAELKPCPFCGCELHERCYTDMYEVACHQCKSSTGLYSTMADAERAWNSRSSADTLASIRAELAEARADKARVDELLTAAVDDYDAAWKALKPFAAIGASVADVLRPDHAGIFSHNDATVTYGDFRRAARAIAGEQKP